MRPYFTEKIIINEPQNVERAIHNLTGKRIDLELIRKSIINEKNTMFYIDRKMNSSTNDSMHSEYLWLDTGYRDERNSPIMISLHNGYNGYVGHYTGTVRELANRVKNYNGKTQKILRKITPGSSLSIRQKWGMFSTYKMELQISCGICTKVS